MFDYTKMTIDQTITDVKRVFHGYQAIAQLVYIAYLAYALIAKTGIWYANLTLLVLATCYFVFFLSTTDYGKTPDGKQLKKNVKMEMTNLPTLWKRARKTWKKRLEGLLLNHVQQVSTSCLQRNVHQLTLLLAR